MVLQQGNQSNNIRVHGAGEGDGGSFITARWRRKLQNVTPALLLSCFDVADGGTPMPKPWVPDLLDDEDADGFDVADDEDDDDRRHKQRGQGG